MTIPHSNRPTLVHAIVVLPSGEWLPFIGRILRLTVIHQRAALDSILDQFSDFYLPLSHLTPSRRSIPRAIGFIFGMGKLEWLGYNLVKVAWWSTHSFGHNTSTWQTHGQTATSPQQMLRQCTASGGKNVICESRKFAALDISPSPWNLPPTSNTPYTCPIAQLGAVRANANPYLNLTLLRENVRRHLNMRHTIRHIL